MQPLGKAMWRFSKKLKIKLDMVAHSHNSSTWETEAGESLLVQGLDYTVRTRGKNKPLKIELPYDPLLGMYQKDSLPAHTEILAHS